MTTPAVWAALADWAAAAGWRKIIGGSLLSKQRLRGLFGKTKKLWRKNLVIVLALWFGRLGSFWPVLGHLGRLWQTWAEQNYELRQHRKNGFAEKMTYRKMAAQESILQREFNKAQKLQSCFSPGFNSQHSQKFNLMLLRFIDGTG